MRRLLLASVALITLALPGLARADDITVTATVNGILVDTIDSGGLPTLDISNTAFGIFNLNSLTLNSEGSLAAPAILNTNVLTVDQHTGGANTLVLHIVASGLTGPGAIEDLLSEFSVTGLTPGWTVQEETSLNGSPLASTPIVSTNSASADVTTSGLVTNPFSADATYTIKSSGTGQFNGGIDINSVGAPGPAAASGLPGIAAMLLGGWLLWRRRHQPA